LITAPLFSLRDQEIICRARWILVDYDANGDDEYDLEIEFKNKAATVAFQMRWLQAMTSYQVEYTPPSGMDRKARVRVSRGDDGEQVWTRELSDEEGAFESQMVHWFIRHNVNEHREFIDPGKAIDLGGWRVDLTEAQHAEFKQAFEFPQYP
jgi:hypothetical protein